MKFRFVATDGVQAFSTISVDKCRPPQVPRLDPQRYRAQWVEACALEAIRRAYALRRSNLNEPDYQVVPPFRHVEVVKLFEG